MPGFNPPNPYGSYFKFGEPEQMAQAAFLPGMSPGVSPGVSTAMGAPTGGFNPTQGEFQRNRYRDIATQQYLAKVLSEDPRVSTFGNTALSAMYGGDAGSANDLVKRLGGRSSFNEMIGFMMNMPGVSGYLGGSQRSLGIGALAAASGGLRMNGVSMFGDGPLQIMAAQSMMRNVTSQFYSPSGAANLGMTSGLNRDQIGGVMMTGGVQGAFAGLDMGKLSMVGDKSQLLANSGTMDKITQFTKNAAKAIGDLMDVFGDSNVADLLNKARQITGLDLSRLGNADTMRSRLAGLRSAAGATGQDVQSLYDTAYGANRMGMAFGLSAAGAGAIGVPTAINASLLMRERSIASGSGPGSFYTAGTSQGELAARGVTDAVGMLRDPLGARRSAIELLIQEGRISGSAAGGIRARMSGMGPSGVPALDAEIRSRYGVSLPGYIASMGGAQRVYENLDEGNKSLAIGDQQNDINVRGGVYLRKFYRQSMGGSRGLAQMEGLMGTFSSENLQSLLGAVDSGKSLADLTTIANSDFGGRTDPAKFVGMALSLKNALPGANLAGLHQSIAHMMSNTSNPFTSQMASLSQQMDRADLYFRNAPSINSIDAGANTRGGLRGGFLQGLLAKADGNDPATIFAIQALVNPDRIAGLSPDSNLSFNASMDTVEWGKQAQSIYREFNKTSEGRKVLVGLGLNDLVNNRTGMGSRELDQMLTTSRGIWMDPIKRSALLSGMSPFGRSNGTNAFMVKEDYERLGNGVGMEAMALTQVGQDMNNRGIRNERVSNLRRMGLMIASGQDGWTINRDTGNFVLRGGKKLTPVELDNLKQQAFTMGTSASLLFDDDFLPKDLKMLAGYRPFGQAAADALFAKDFSLRGVPGEDAEKRRAAIRKKEAVLTEMGFVGRTDGVQRIVGTLKFSDDKTSASFGPDAMLIGPTSGKEQ